MVHSKKKRSRGRLYFPEILYQVVDDPSTDSLISWSESGESFILWNESEFIRDVLPRFFKVKVLSLFTNRLHCNGFTKVVGSELFEYAHESFVRGKPDEFKKRARECFFILDPPELRKMRESQIKQRMLDIKRVWAIRRERSKNKEGAI